MMTRIADLVSDALSEHLPRDITIRANWIDVTKHELADARQSTVLITLAGMATVLLFGGVIHPLLRFPEFGAHFDLTYGLATLGFVIIWLVPLTALLIGTTAITRERESGRLRVLLGLPITRRDVLIGKLLGRSILVGVIVLVGLTVSGGVLWQYYQGFILSTYALFAGLTVTFGLVFVWIGIGISAFFQSTARAMGTSVSVFALLVFLWNFVPKGAFYLVHGQYPENVPPPWDPPTWLIFLGNVNPTNSFLSLFNAWSPQVSINRLGRYHQYSGDGPAPLFLQPEFLLLTMLLWGIIPVLLGARRFSRSDLG